MGIIAAIAVPTTIGVINRQKKNAAVKSAETVLAAAKTVLLEVSANGEKSDAYTGTATTGVTKDGEGDTLKYEVTSAGLKALGELEKDPCAVSNGSGTFKVSLTVKTNTFSVTLTSVKIDGLDIVQDATVTDSIAFKVE